jgi:hypothetical protein
MKWIKVEDQLPFHEEGVLACPRYSGHPEYRTSEEIRQDALESEYRNKETEWSHWMRLPKRPTT